jgi:hypothetical protein
MFLSSTVRNVIEKKKIEEILDKCIKREAEKSYNRIKD